jgi:RHS repeat-associated protein
MRERSVPMQRSILRKHTCRHFWFRSVAFVLVPAHVALSAPAFADAAAVQAAKAPAVAPPPAPPEVKVNRTVPKVTPPPAYPVFSANPTTEQLTRARVFGEPLLPVGGTPTALENDALARAVTAWLRGGDPEATGFFEDFLVRYPSSPWRASLAANLGVVYEKHGYFGRAEEKYRLAWELSRNLTDPAASAVGDQSISELLCMGMKFGRVETVEELLADMGERTTEGRVLEMAKAAVASAWQLRNDHSRAIPSGPVALDRLLVLANPGEKRPREISDFHATENGATLREIEALAQSVGLPLRTAFRGPGAEMVMPAVAHLKRGHYSAVIREEKGRILLDDPLLGGELWMSRAAFEEETSGFFLVPEGPLPNGWRAANDAELEAIRGKCQSTWGDWEFDCFGNKICPPGRRCGPGMAEYGFATHLASLVILDSPVGYNPPRGPASFLQLTYHQRQSLQPTTFTFTNVSDAWSIGWVAWIEDNPANPLATVRTHLGNAGAETSSAIVGSAYAPTPRSRAVLVRTSTSPIRYERRLPDGSVEVFAQADGAATFPRRIFMTQSIDPQGNTLSYTYDAQLRLVAVTDAVGQVTTLSYDLMGNPLKLTRVTDPFGRMAKLEYNSLGRLVRVVDVLGMNSEFDYQGSFVRAMTTPYGTTTFTTGLDKDIYWHPLMHWIQATDPLGGTERMEYHLSNASFQSTEPASSVPVGFAPENASLHANATFYWDKRAMALYPGDYTKAQTTKWLMGALWKVVDSKHSEKMPLENRVWYAYDSNPTIGWVGPLHKMPSKVARVLDDGSSQAYRYEYNRLGKKTEATDPLGRAKVYVYGNNNTPDANPAAGTGFDLLQVKQRNPSAAGGYDLLMSYTYSAQHLPLTMTDTSGQVTTYSYDTHGQLLTDTTPPRAGITENRTVSHVYDPNGHLLTSTEPAAGATSTFTYDGYGRVRTAIDEVGYMLTYDYDELDRTTKITYPDGTYEQVVYDRLDARDRRDRLGRWSHYSVDAVRHLINVVDPKGRNVRQEWCSCGSLDSFIDSEGNKTSWERDLQGRITKETRADDKAWLYAFENTTSRLHQVTDPKGQTKTYAYNVDDSTHQVVYGTAAVPTPPVSYTYDTNYNRLATMVDGVGTTVFGYKPVDPTPTTGNNRLQSVDGPFANDTTHFVYDELGRVVQRGLVGQLSTYAYDALGRLSSQSESMGAWTFGYVGVTDRLQFVTYPNGVTSNYSYFGNTGDQQLQQIKHTRSGGAVISQYDYTYDPWGKVRTWRQQPPTGPAKVYDFGYDTTDELTSAILRSTDPTPVTIKRYAYGFDAAGNRIADQVDDAGFEGIFNSRNQLISRQPAGNLLFRGSINEPGTVAIQGQSAQVGADNRFEGSAALNPGTNTATIIATDPSGNARTNTYEVPVSGTATTYTYDVNGNLTSNGTRVFEYDAENRLTRVTSGAGELARYIYGGQGLRVQKIAGGVTHTYIHDFTDVREERLSMGATLRYVNGLEIDETLAVQDGATTSYYLVDHLGSVVQTIDSAGNVVSEREYDPYGSIVAGSSAAGYAFTGREWEPEVSLYYYRARFYDAQIGRFLTEDPIGIEGSTADVARNTLYVYSENDPVNFVDPLGLTRRRPRRRRSVRLPCPELGKLITANNACPGMSGSVVLCIVLKESSGNPNARAPKPNTASGLMQVNRRTAKQQKCDWAKAFDPGASIQCGTKNLCWLMKHFTAGNARQAVALNMPGPGGPPNNQYASDIDDCVSCLGTRACEKCQECNPNNP